LAAGDNHKTEAKNCLAAKMGFEREARTGQSSPQLLARYIIIMCILPSIQPCRPVHQAAEQQQPDINATSDLRSSGFPSCEEPELRSKCSTSSYKALLALPAASPEMRREMIRIAPYREALQRRGARKSCSRALLTLTASGTAPVCRIPSADMAADSSAVPTALAATTSPPF